MLRFLKDPLLRRFATGSLFAIAFVWVAIRWFNVNQEVVWVFAILSFVLIGILILLGFFLSFVLHPFMQKKGGGMLDHFEERIADEAPEDKSGEP